MATNSFYKKIQQAVCSATRCFRSSAPRNRTLISSGVAFTGDLVAEDNIVIHGTMNGNIRSSKHVVLGNSAHFDGIIESESATISGTINGRIQTLKNIIVRVPATITGDLLSASVEVEAGVVLRGRIMSNTSLPYDTNPNAWFKTLEPPTEPMEPVEPVER